MSRGVLPQIDAHVALFAEGRNCTSLFAGLGVMTWILTSFDLRKYRYVWLELEDRNISFTPQMSRLAMIPRSLVSLTKVQGNICGDWVARGVQGTIAKEGIGNLLISNPEDVSPLTTPDQV